MNRREAIKTLTALSVIAILPKIIFSANPTTSKIHFVGLGGGGCNALEHIYKKGVKAKYTCITSPTRPHLPLEIKFIRFDSPKEHFSTDDFEDYFSLSTEIENVFRNDSTYILMAGFGGYTGTNLTRELSKYLSKRNKKFMVICSMPFQFEGRGRNSFALRTKKELDYYPNFKCFDLEMIREIHGDMVLSKAFAKADEQFYTIFKNNYQVS